MQSKDLQWISEMNELGKKKVPFFFIFDFELDFPIIVPLNSIKQRKILFSCALWRNTSIPNVHRNGIRMLSINDIYYSTLKPRFLTRRKYAGGFNYVQDEQYRGNSFLTNLTSATEIAPALRSLRTLFCYVSAPYKLWLRLPTQHRRMSMVDEILVFSPESFIQTFQDRIHTFPMKGTASLLPDSDYDQVKQQLLNNAKEEAEHITVVDLLRNDLGRVASNVQVHSLRSISEITTTQGSLLQTSSHISAELPLGWRNGVGDMFSELLPAGSVSGAPKRRTCEIISRAESILHGSEFTERRGFYCGVAGVFNGQDIDSCVLIRFIERRGSKFYFRSGGGITVYSDLDEEYEELRAKVKLPL